MKKLLIILSFLSYFKTPLFGQYQQEAFNSTKNIMLFRKDSTNAIIFYDIDREKVIKKYRLRKPYCSSKESDNYYDYSVGFSPNGKIFYILNTFEDTNYTHKNWQPNKYFQEYVFNLVDSGCRIDKTVKLSTLNFYSSQNGQFLFSLKDTGFCYVDLSRTSFAGAPSYRRGLLKLPCYIRNISFFKNSDSLLIVNTYNGYEYEERKFSIWNLNKKKNLFGYSNLIDFDCKLSKDKKYYYRIFNNNYSPPISGKYRDSYRDFNQVNFFQSSNFKLIREYKQSDIQEEKITEQINNLIYDSLINYTFHNKIQRIISNQSNKKYEYSKDSSIVAHLLSDRIIEIKSTNPIKLLKTIKFATYVSDFCVTNSNKLLVFQDDYLMSIYDVIKNKLVNVNDIGEKK